MSLSRRALLFGHWADPSPSPSPPPAAVNWLGDRAVEALPGGQRIAKVQPFSCLNAMGSFCSTCVERCPVPGAIRAEGRRVLVAAETCTGCGICADVCPAPGNAILLVPFRSAP